MAGEAVLALAVVVAALIFMATTRIPPDLILLGALAILFVGGVLDAGEALSGFSNEGMITVAVLYVIGAGVVETGAVGWLAERLFGRPRSVTHAIFRMSAPTAFLSGFMNNTPLVAMMIPAVNDWAKKHRIAPSKLMIPLSYAAILGGTCTLIGTSTNLVVNGLIIRAHEAQVAAGITPSIPRGMSMFDITWVGVPAAVAGILFMVAFHKYLLPNRLPAIATTADPRQYTIEMMVEPNSPLIGKSIEEAGLRHLPGLYLAEIDREGAILPAVAPEERLRANDRLVFVGIVDSVVDLQKIRGLSPATDQVFKLDSPRSQRCLIEAVASSTCPVVGKTIRDGRFRSIYNAVVLAVARQGERVQGKVGDIVLQPGDTLLLEAHPSFVGRHRNSRHFFLVSKLENSTPPRYDRAATALGILAVLVAVVTLSESIGAIELSLGQWQCNLGSVTMLKGALLAAALMFLTRCLRIEEARRAIDWQTLLAIAASFGLGTALAKTGAADQVTGLIVGLVGGNAWLSLAAVYVVTVLVSELITNNAAAALMFPFALATAGNLGVNPMSFIVAVMFGASTAFATPIGYQTNLMVWGPGGYKFSDYLRIGVPMDWLVGVIVVVLVPLFWPF